jgi:hypothetical protein
MPTETNFPIPKPYPSGRSIAGTTNIERLEDIDDKEKPNTGELGSTFGYQELFSGFNEGLVFKYDDAMPRDFKDMLDKDGKAQGIESLLAFPIIAAPRDIQGAKGDKGEADKIREILTANPYEGGMSTSLETLISQMTASMTYKRTYFEKVYTIRDDGKVGYRKIAWRPPETCELALHAENGDYMGFRQTKITYGLDKGIDEYGYVMIPPHRAFVYIHGVWRDPVEGISAMQIPYWCYQTKQRIRFLWYQFLENNVLPKTVVKHPDEAKAREDAKKFATMKARAVIGMEQQTSVDAYESAGHGAAGYIEAIRFLDSEMSNSVLGGFMDLTASAASGKGSFALSEDQSKLFLRTRRVVARDMARQFNEQVIAPLVIYNFGRKAAFPQLKFGPLSEANEATVLNLFETLATAARPTVPNEFYDELIVRTAAILELDTDKVAKAIQTEGSPLEKLVNSVAPIAGAVGAATGTPVPGAAPTQNSISPEQILAEAGAKNGK